MVCHLKILKESPNSSLEEEKEKPKTANATTIPHLKRRREKMMKINNPMTKSVDRLQNYLKFQL